MSIKYKGQTISGAPGKSATINGENAIDIVAGDNVEIEQQDGTLTISATGGGSGNGEVYSTEETVIGTWIDDKPIYRRVIQKTITDNSFNVLIATIPELNSPVSISGFFKYHNSTNNFEVPIPYATSSISISFWLYNDTKEIHFFGTGMSDITDVTCIIEYTKTTD